MEEAPKVKRRIVGKQDIQTPEQNKIATIEKVYYNDATGYRSLKDPWKAAKVLDKSITEKDIKDQLSHTRCSRPTCCFSQRQGRAEGRGHKDRRGSRRGAKRSAE